MCQISPFSKIWLRHLKPSLLKPLMVSWQSLWMQLKSCLRKVLLRIWESNIAFTWDPLHIIDLKMKTDRNYNLYITTKIVIVSNLHSFTIVAMYIRWKLLLANHTVRNFFKELEYK